MKRTIVLFLLAVALVPPVIGYGATLTERPGAKLKSEVRAGFQGRQVEDRSLSVRSFGLGLDGRFSYELLPRLEAALRLDAKLEEGAVESIGSLGESPYAPRKDLKLRKGSLAYGAGFAEVEAGILDQDENQLPMLVDSAGFVGAKESVSFGKRFFLKAQAQQSIPRTSSSIEATGQSTSGMPAFFLEEVRVGWKGSNLETWGRGFHYLFSNPTTGMAQKSRFLGNTVVGLGSSNARYVYDYYGFGAGGGLSWEPHPMFGVGLQGMAAQNQDAPAGANQMSVGELSLKWRPQSSFEFSPRLRVFRQEADSSPAVYSEKDFGFKNRTGWTLGARAEFKEYHAFVQGDWAVAETLRSNPYQGSFRSVQFVVGGHYELF